MSKFMSQKKSKILRIVIFEFSNWVTLHRAWISLPSPEKCITINHKSETPSPQERDDIFLYGPLEATLFLHLICEVREYDVTAQTWTILFTETSVTMAMD